MENLIYDSPELLIALFANFLVILILFFMNLSNRSKIKKLKNRYKKFMNGLSDRNMEQLLDEYFEKVNIVDKKNKEIENHVNYIERNMMQCIQKVGIVRFNAFDNVGSDLSFSISLLDNNDNGIVLSGLYSRESTSTYAKPIEAGKSKYVLSAEESQAIDIAKKNNGERLYTDKYNLV